MTMFVHSAASRRIAWAVALASALCFAFSAERGIAASDPSEVPGGEEFSGKVETKPTPANPYKPASHRCFVRDVMVFYDRTHVRCYNRARGKINFFAVDTGQPVTESLLTKAWRSMRTGKPLTISYVPTPDLNPSNCEASNCRRLLDATN